MKEIYNRLLRLALTVGLTEREAFVDKVSEVIARKTSADPRYGERLAEGVLAAVEALRDELLLRQAFARSSQRESGREERPAEYRELIDRIDRLNRTLEANGVGGIVESVRGKRRIVPELVSCDLFDHLSGSADAGADFRGSYLKNYSWAEGTLAELMQNYYRS